MDKQPKPSGAPGVRPATGAPKGLDELNMAILNRMGGLAGVLRGWKEIAGFLRVHKMTAMRYHKFRGMPVSYITRRPITTPWLLSMWIAYLDDTRVKK